MKRTHYNEHGHPIPDGMTPTEWVAYLDAQTNKALACWRDDCIARGEDPDEVEAITVPLRPLPIREVESSLRGLCAPTLNQRLLRLVRPFRRRNLKRNIRAWLPDALKTPRSIKADFVAEWSFELRTTFGE